MTGFRLRQISFKLRWRAAGHGFTLVELLIAVSLMSIVSIGVYSMFVSGIRVSERLQDPMLGEDISIFLEKFSRDIQSLSSYKGIPFEAKPNSFSFMAPIKTLEELGGAYGIGKVTFTFEEKKKRLLRREDNISDIFDEETGAAKMALTGVSDLLFKYLVYYKDAQQYAWVEEWSELESNGVIPAAIKIEFLMEHDKKRDIKSFTVQVPIGSLKG